MWSPWNGDTVLVYAASISWPELSIRTDADQGISKASHCEELFQLPGQSAAIKLPPGKLSLS